MRTLILYASTHGHTAKIASHLAEAVRRENCDVDIRDARHDASPVPADYEGVLVAASLHGGHHQREVVDWTKRHRDALSRRYSIFLGAFVAPPFSGLDTLPSLGVVLLSLGVLLEDALIATAGIAIGAGGISLVLLLSRAAVRGVAELALWMP